MLRSKRADFEALFARCLEDQSCAELLSGSALQSCAAEAAPGPSPSGAAFCEDLLKALSSCSLPEHTTLAECRGLTARYSDAAIADARACLDDSCDRLVGCVDSKLPPLKPPDNAGGAGPGGLGGSGSGGGSGGSSSTGQPCAGTAVRCLDSLTVQFCNDAGLLEEVACPVGMAQEGIISEGCQISAEGAGCTVDDFADLGCAMGSPALAVCAGLSESDLLDLYVACFQDRSAARSRISCYQDHVDASGLIVDCDAAAGACAE